MNTIILAGGHASRLWPITESFPKALLRIAGKPILYYLFDNIRQGIDIENLIIAFEKKDIDLFSSFESEYVNVFRKKPILFPHNTNNDGSLKGPITKINEIIIDPKIKLKGDILILGGDNYFGFDLTNFVQFYYSEQKSCNAIQIKRKIEESEYGAPNIDSTGRFTEFEEKPAKQIETRISTFCYLFKKEDIVFIKDYLIEKQEDNMGLFLKWLIKRTDIIGYQFDEEWYDIGTRYGIFETNASLIKSKISGVDLGARVFQNHSTLKEPVYIGDATNIEHSIIGENVYIDANCKIINSKIGPNVYIDMNTIVENSTVDNSIIYAGCEIKDGIIMNAVLGKSIKCKGQIKDAILPNMTK